MLTLSVFKFIGDVCFIFNFRYLLIKEMENARVLPNGRSKNNYSIIHKHVFSKNRINQYSNFYDFHCWNDYHDTSSFFKLRKVPYFGPCSRIKFIILMVLSVGATDVQSSIYVLTKPLPTHCDKALTSGWAPFLNGRGPNGKNINLLQRKYGCIPFSRSRYKLLS